MRERFLPQDARDAVGMINLVACSTNIDKNLPLLGIRNLMLPSSAQAATCPLRRGVLASDFLDF